MLISELCLPISSTPSAILLESPSMLKPAKSRHGCFQQSPSPAMASDRFEYPVSPFNGSASPSDLSAGEGNWDPARILPSPIMQMDRNGHYISSVLNSRPPILLPPPLNTAISPKSTADVASEFSQNSVPGLRSRGLGDTPRFANVCGVSQPPFFQNQTTDHTQPWGEGPGHLMASNVPQKRPKIESDDSETSQPDDGCDKKARFAKATTACRPVYEFSCPYYKRNRQKYCQQRSCRTSGWPSVHRVKEHLYRHHMHYVCERCSSTFKQLDQLRQHLRQEVACPVSSRRAAEDSGFDQELEKKLRSRKKIDGQTEPEKWIHMFHLLFPSFKDKGTPSPYVDYSVRNDPGPTAPLTQPLRSSPQQDCYSGVDASAMVEVAAAAERHLLQGEQSTGYRREDGSAADSRSPSSTLEQLDRVVVDHASGEGDRTCDHAHNQDISSPTSMITSEMLAEAQSLAPQLSKRFIRKMFQQQLQAVLANMPSSPASSIQGEED